MHQKPDTQLKHGTTITSASWNLAFWQPLASTIFCKYPESTESTYSIAALTSPQRKKDHQSIALELQMCLLKQPLSHESIVAKTTATILTWLCINLIWYCCKQPHISNT
jgi:hypothetical protein